MKIDQVLGFLSVERCQSISRLKFSTFESLLLFIKKNMTRQSARTPTKHRQQRSAATPTEIPTIIGTLVPEELSVLVTASVEEEVVFVLFGVGVGVEEAGGV